MSEYTEKFTDVQESHFLRALELIADSWGNDDDLTIEVVNDRINFQEFLDNTHLDKYEIKY